MVRDIPVKRGLDGDTYDCFCGGEPVFTTDEDAFNRLIAGRREKCGEHLRLFCANVGYWKASHHLLSTQNIGDSL